MILSSHLLNKYIPFLVLNILAVYLDLKEIEEDKVNPTWKPLPINASNFKVEDDNLDGIKFSVTTMDINNVILNTYNYHRSIISKAYYVK
jgi:hypothetical protein